MEYHLTFGDHEKDFFGRLFWESNKNLASIKSKISYDLRYG